MEKDFTIEELRKMLEAKEKEEAEKKKVEEEAKAKKLAEEKEIRYEEVKKAINQANKLISDFVDDYGTFNLRDSYSGKYPFIHFLNHWFF